MRQLKAIKQNFQHWRDNSQQIQQEEYLNQKAYNLRYYLLAKRFFVAIKKQSDEKQNQIEKLKAASYYYKRCVFYKLLNGFYNSIQDKKQKRISLKHYAVKILESSFLKWKKFSLEKYERQFYKIMSSSKRDTLENSISNYTSEKCNENQLSNNNKLNKFGMKTQNQIKQSNYNGNNNNQLQQSNNQNNLFSNISQNSSIHHLKDSNFNLSNNFSNQIQNSTVKKDLTLSTMKQTDL